MTTAAASYQAPSLSLIAPTTWTQGFFTAAMAIIWLHFLDASIVHPQANATLAEHALQVLAALLIPPLAIIAFSRAGRWMRSVSAFTSGLALMMVGGVIHVAGPFRNGFESADVTGIALIPAGAILFVIGAATFVRVIPRRRYRPLLLLAVPLLLYAGLPTVSAVYATHVPRLEITDVDMGAPHESVSFETADGKTIRGWYVPSTNGAAVMILHGAGGARTGVAAHSRMLVRHGYGVLAFDVRGHGESTGTTIALGWGAHPDVLAAVSFLEARDDVEAGRVGALGLSMGAEVVLDAAWHESSLAAVVADGGGTRSVNEVRSRKLTLGRGFELPLYAINAAMVTLLSDGVLPPPALKGRVDRIVAPTMLISGNIPEERDMNRIWFGNITAPKELWEVDAGHTRGLHAHPEEYERRVLGFFASALLDAAEPVQ